MALKLSNLKLIGALFFCLVFTFSGLHQAHAGPYKKNTTFYQSKHMLAPFKLFGKTIIFQIETVEPRSPTNYPNKGIIVQTYDYYNLSYKAYGDREFQGDTYYKYKRLGYKTAKEKYVDALTGDRFETRFSFTSPNKGTWRRSINNGEWVIAGNFIIESPNSTQLAPDNHNNTTVSLSVLGTQSELPAGSFPSLGSVILQSYTQENTYTAQGFGPGTVAHLGEYQYQRISANVAIEQTLQTIPDLGLTAPYTMIYIYETPYSGRWYQNFADGLILFSGSFTTFPTSH